MRIVWSPFAIQRVIEISRYIEQESPKNSLSFTQEIFKRVEGLKQFPKIGKFVPELEERNTREIIFSSFKIIYRIEEDRLLILTVLHMRQFDWETNEI